MTARSHGSVTFVGAGPGDEGLLTVRPDDAAIKDSTFAATVGCRVNDLPKPSRGGAGHFAPLIRSSPAGVRIQSKAAGIF